MLAAISPQALLTLKHAVASDRLHLVGHRIVRPVRVIAPGAAGKVGYIRRGLLPAAVQCRDIGEVEVMRTDRCDADCIHAH